MQTTADLSQESPNSQLHDSRDPGMRSLWHLALVYRPEEAPGAVRFFELLGCTVQDMGPHRDSAAHWYTVLLDHSSSFNENVVFLIPAAPAVLQFDDKLRGFLAGPENGPTSVPGTLAYHRFTDFAAADPERSFHFGLMCDSFPSLEGAAIALRDAGAPGGELEGRVSIVNVFRPTPGIDPDIDARMAASPIVRDDHRLCMAPRSMQLWLKTDLFACNIPALGQVVELDYVFS